MSPPRSQSPKPPPPPTFIYPRFVPLRTSTPCSEVPLRIFDLTHEEHKVGQTGGDEGEEVGRDSKLMLEKLLRVFEFRSPELSHQDRPKLKHFIKLESHRSGAPGRKGHSNRRLARYMALGSDVQVCTSPHPTELVQSDRKPDVSSY